MFYSLDQDGVLQAVMEDFEQHRLPRIMDIKEKVEQGEVLNDFDIEFLDEVLSDTQNYESFVDKHPDYQQLFARVAHLYETITEKALENEQRTG